MQQRLNHFMLLFVILAVLVTSAVRTTVAYADDGGTEPVPEESTSPAGEEEASVEETSPAEEPAAVGEVVELETSAPAEVAATEPAVEEPVSVAEVLEQLPEGTELVVINEAGEVEPLVTAEAAEVVATSDPIWCPDGQVPTPGANGCTPSFTNFASLITELSSGSYTGNGTIWVESSYNGADDNQIEFNGTTLTTLSNHSLTVRGGWSGTSANTSITGTSLADVSMAFVNWNGNITLENFDIANPGDDAGFGLYIENTGNVTLNNVSVTGVAESAAGPGDGAIVNTTGKVNINNSEFDHNDGTGLHVESDNAITLNNVSASGNVHGAGVVLKGREEASHIVVKGGDFSQNGTSGIKVTSENAGTWLENVTASLNRFRGAYLITLTSFGIVNSQFIENGSCGIYAVTYEGEGYLYDTTVLGDNGIDDGAPGADDLTDTGAVLISNYLNWVSYSTFSYNTGVGLIAMSREEVGLNGITVEHNGGNGVEVCSLSTTSLACSADQSITVSLQDESRITNNGGYGLVVDPGLEGRLVFLGENIFSGNLQAVVLGQSFFDGNLQAIVFGGIDAQGQAIINQDGTITINYIVSEEELAQNYSILFWDQTMNSGAGDWVELPLYEDGTSLPLNPEDPNDPRTIVSGVKQIGNIVTVTVDFSGVFALTAQ